ncbi:hypothetical protein Y032_0068g234 [Ancylostoma ceylanicum]|nr:hypothetical protein Y032_0068g234 [Ancylostoma ceylanicum]
MLASLTSSTILAILFVAAAATSPTDNATTAAPTRKPWPKPNCGNPSMTNSLRNLFLNMHNNFRGRLARGQTERSAGWGIAPPATLMYRMNHTLISTQALAIETVYRHQLCQDTKKISMS